MVTRYKLAFIFFLWENLLFCLGLFLLFLYKNWLRKNSGKRLGLSEGRDSNIQFKTIKLCLCLKKSTHKRLRFFNLKGLSIESLFLLLFLSLKFIISCLWYIKHRKLKLFEIILKIIISFVINWWSTKKLCFCRILVRATDSWWVVSLKWWGCLIVNYAGAVRLLFRRS